MKKRIIILCCVLIISSIGLYAQEQTKLRISSWLVSGFENTQMPVFNNDKNINDKGFTTKDLLKFKQNDISNWWPSEGESNEISSWKKLKANKSGEISLGKSKNIENNTIVYLVSYVMAERWLEVDFSFESPYMFEIYVDGKFVKGNYDVAENESRSISKKIALDQGKHMITAKCIFSSGKDFDWKFAAYASTSEPYKFANIQLNTDPTINMNMKLLLDGVRSNSISLSADGSMYLIGYSERFPPNGKTKRWFEVRKSENNELVHSFLDSKISGLKWLPIGNKIAFDSEGNEGRNVFVFDLDEKKITSVMEDVQNLGSYTWSDDESFIIYSIYENYEKKNDLVKKLEGMEDRLPWYRGRSFLYKYDISKKQKQRLTFGNVTTSLQDICPCGSYIIYSESIPDYTNWPYSKQKMCVLDLETLNVDTLWNQNIGGSVSFSPDAQKLLITGAPNLFGDIGLNLSKAKIPNIYDNQAYIYDISSKKVEPISKNFNPSINSSYWSKSQDIIYFTTTDKTYNNLYAYNLSSKIYTLINTGEDMVSSANFSTYNNKATYIGSGQSSNEKAYLIDLNTFDYTLLSDPEVDEFKHLEFGKFEDWVYTTTEGVEIDGRVYYPPNFDSNKKYPLIVNYYAGTSPVSRSFRGRYPLNYYAALGYVVYVLQPSGTFGYGQDYSAAHVNNWGLTVADEIIESSKEFISTHPFIDGNSVGCIGASYGGFMTMLLTTRTNMFAAAISHAGISSISSYWGEGYWGYSYSAAATANSFPWNNKQLYVDQSPLFHADKINTPLLLLHGNSDTNVPPGESYQLFTALKILGKDVEMIEILNQDHHILDYKKRIQWQKTIHSYFDKYLKDQPEWWNNLYPATNL